MKDSIQDQEILLFYLFDQLYELKFLIYSFFNQRIVQNNIRIYLLHFIIIYGKLKFRINKSYKLLWELSESTKIQITAYIYVYQRW